ncbi:mannitol dehydrogenase family protein [Rhodococcus sp. 06-156-3C]|uniref:mannitol dehydrogenase family protein n=1 Tax=Nocardiaceae TaxID=85025 RepID=UPI000522FC4A|nr:MULTISPECIES: mannitol dehydrogenase family protein [Rhodococcus]OZD08385.1 mannitol dehydrogenase family protein [Rhodococcus sp. 06-156-4C]OZD12887.1 mannitol dehydrogenase family protein [Rhodococcus sp. 06-156-3C]OZD23325.1 mannitol dehydrogenase family protein [Rhodococcus sp. 06-156-4a]OZD36459.1 mannitol dehydrogenase family protein [Rhodococcus sp. 06-156-3]OZD36684.1 mannitol dehydrogenase family protein [Rhodococcus sp. 06-156-3b]
MKLNSRTLDDFIEGVAVPTYDRSDVTAGIVHFGVGGFHRAHQAMYVDRLLQQGEASEWGICGVGVLPGDRKMKDVMDAQDCLYTLALKHADGTWDTRVIGSIVEYLFAPDDPEAVIEKMAAESTRIVSLTITEGGYNFSATTGEFDAENPSIQADLKDGAVPSTTFGLVVAALARRKDRGLKPFTIMSCDNIEGNGHIAQSTFTAFAHLKDPELAQWLTAEGAFPNSMVDRITPVTTPEVVQSLSERYALDDQWPVAGEPFTQWVLEDKFTLGRPPFEDVGVQVVEDVTPYELMKLRLLNASHQALAYFGYLSGYRLVHEVAQDSLFSEFLLAYMNNEATPTLQPVPGIDLGDYKKTLIERFSNPEIRDTVARLCAESSDRIPKWLLPVIRKNLETGGDIRLSTAVVASWARYAEGVDEQGQPIEIVDQLADTLIPIARKQHDDPTAFIANRAVFGDLIDNERFVTEYRTQLDSLHSEGARATLERLRHT